MPHQIITPCDRAPVPFIASSAFVKEMDVLRYTPDDNGCCDTACDDDSSLGTFFRKNNRKDEVVIAVQRLLRFDRVLSVN